MCRLRVGRGPPFPESSCKRSRGGSAYTCGPCASSSSCAARACFFQGIPARRSGAPGPSIAPPARCAGGKHIRLRSSLIAVLGIARSAMAIPLSHAPTPPRGDPPRSAPPHPPMIHDRRSRHPRRSPASLIVAPLHASMYIDEHRGDGHRWRPMPAVDTATAMDRPTLPSCTLHLGNAPILVYDLKLPARKNTLRRQT